MAKVFMVRHQKAGIVTSHAFAASPTPAQVAPIVAECERLHGRGGWVNIHEAELLTNAVPSFPKRDAGAPGAVVLPVSVSGRGTVT